MMKLKITLLLLVAFVFSTNLNAQKYTNLETSKVEKDHHGVTFSSEKTLVENLATSPEFKITTSILERLEGLLAEDAMVTVFVPDDSAYRNFSKEEMEALLKDEGALREIMKFHIIPGRLDDQSIKKAIENGGGVAYFATLQGEKIGIRVDDWQVVLFDKDKDVAVVSFYDFYHKNGFFHIVNGLVKPTAQK